jgi:hypothetical protein
LFDLRLDPHELRDVAASHPESSDPDGVSRRPSTRSASGARTARRSAAASREIPGPGARLGCVDDGGGD